MASLGRTAVLAVPLPAASSPPVTSTNLPAGPRTWYVDANYGDDDLYDGTAEIGNGHGKGNGKGTGNNSSTNLFGTVTSGAWAANSGPKKSISAVLAGAVPGDTITVAAGIYAGSVNLDGIRMIINGRVELQ